MRRKPLTEEERKQELKVFLEENGALELFPYEWLCATDFFRAPASREFHAAYPGGLYDHSMNVTKVLLELEDKGVIEPWERGASPFIVGILHDATKIGMYQPCQIDNAGNNEYVHSVLYKTFGGHGSDSVRKIEQHVELTEEERLCIRYHMGAYELDDWEGYDAAIQKFPNVLWTHTADMIASKLMEV